MTEPGLTMWTCGWLLGKFDQLTRLPANVAEAKIWKEGFTVGNADIHLHENLEERLELLLLGHPKSQQLVASISPNYTGGCHG